MECARRNVGKSTEETRGGNENKCWELGRRKEMKKK